MSGSISTPLAVTCRPSASTWSNPGQGAGFGATIWAQRQFATSGWTAVGRAASELAVVVLVADVNVLLGETAQPPRNNTDKRRKSLLFIPLSNPLINLQPPRNRGRIPWPGRGPHPPPARVIERSARALESWLLPARW